MKKERKWLSVDLLESNVGQLTWLPINPRQWTEGDVELTSRSIMEDPDFLEDRPLLVIPTDGGRFVVFAGNLRREGCVAQQMKTAPCVVYHPETDEDRLAVKRRALKDNGSFGAWDYDTLANRWDDLPLTDWGVPAWDTNPQQSEEEPAGPSKPRETETLKIELSPDELNFVKRRLLEHGNDEREGLLNLLGYETE